MCKGRGRGKGWVEGRSHIHAHALMYIHVLFDLPASYLTVQSWLLNDPHMEPRSMYPPFVQAGDQYLKALLPIVSPLQVMYKSFDPIRLYTLSKFLAVSRWKDNVVSIN